MSAPFGLADGGSGAILTFPEAWPPRHNEQLRTVPTLTPDLDIQLHVSPPGVIEVWFVYQGERRKVFTSARVDFPRDGSGLVYVSWSRVGVGLSIGGDDIPAYSQSAGVHYLALTPHLPGTGAHAFTHPDRDAHCATWMQWRRLYLSSDQVPAGRIAKTIGEQLVELQEATARIREILGFLEVGKLHWVGPLAVELRALLKWREDDFGPKPRKYKSIPLLFRVAQYRDLPLPVYALPPQKETTPDATQVRFDTFTLTHDSGHQRLVDLQQWLTHPALFDPIEDSWGMKDLISSYAETKGPGHYDTGVPQVYDLLARTGVGYTSTSVTFLYEVGSGVNAVAEHVLERFATTP